MWPRSGSRARFRRGWGHQQEAVSEVGVTSILRATLGAVVVGAGIAGGVYGGEARGTVRPHRRWTVADIVQIKRIVGTAVRGASRVAAFIVEAPSLEDDENHYLLFQVSPGRAPRRLAASDFMSNLEWRPGTTDWTVRADFGKGVQLYDITKSGHVSALLLNKDLALVGGHTGLVGGDTHRPRLTGVLSYQWAPDGRHFWYSKVRLRSAAARAPLRHGIVYDDTRMAGVKPADLRRAIEYAGTELHVVDARTGIDRLVAFDGMPTADTDRFRYRYGSTRWVTASTLQYRVTAFSPYLSRTLWRFNVRSGRSKRVLVAMSKAKQASAFYSVPVASGLVTVDRTAGRRCLCEMSLSGRIERAFARGNFLSVNPAGATRGGVWSEPRQDRWIFSVRYADRDGLVFYPSTSATEGIRKIHDTVNECAFNRDLTFGVCNRESLTEAPALIAVAPDSGKITVLARPDARYGRIAPLHTVARSWRNRYGDLSTGYVTYPSHYRAHRKYPALLVTHGHDARNRFAWDGFQWEIPIQVFAAEGFFVLSVNEPVAGGHAAPAPYMKGAARTSVAALQFANSVNPMAGLEGAVESLIDGGRVDPREVGIAAYSHGAETASFTITHSHVFAAASIADDSWWDAGDYWVDGAFGRHIYDHFFGGAPFDRQAYPNYLQYSPSARAADASGPVLEQFSGYESDTALEFYELLRHARIPAELVMYPGESHIFYGPRDRAAAMRRNLDWFNYWLLGRRDAHPADPDEYGRWARMARRWKGCAAECRRRLRLTPGTKDRARAMRTPGSAP